MLLLIDAGNTRVKWALAGSKTGQTPASEAAGNLPRTWGQWTAYGMAPRDEVAQLAAAWRAHPITHALVSNVAGPEMRCRLEQVLAQAGSGSIKLEWFASTAQRGGIQNAYRNPAQLGCDRFASAIGAHALFPAQPLIVATCGTATTVDAVTAQGTFLGGMILPGLAVMAQSLAANTAQLPQVGETVEVNTPFADHTDAAIVSGCLAAQAGAIERAAKAHPQAQGAVHCIISGGAGAMIAPHLTVPHAVIDNLVLIGLQAVAQQEGAWRT